MSSSRPSRPARRKFIRIVGTGGVVLAAAAGAGVAAGAATGFFDDVPEDANRPWRTAGTPTDPRLKALSYAILAPNPHNIQPWMVDLKKPDEIVLYCDRSRLLPETDPYNRQILIGHGCFIELLTIAAAEMGLRAVVEPFPAGVFPNNTVDDRPVARIRLMPGGEKKDPLFAQILARRSAKEPYDKARLVPEVVLNGIASKASVPATRISTTNAPDRLAYLKSVIWKAHEIEVMTPRTLMESVRLMRIGRSEISKHRDGIDIGGPMIEVGRWVGAITRKDLGDPKSDAFKQGLDMYREMAATAGAFGWITTPDNSRTAQLAAGRAYVRFNLAATAADVAIHPWSQVLQEYPEMAKLQAEFFDRIGQKPGERVQMLIRMGYAAPVPASPRRPLGAIVKA